MITSESRFEPARPRCSFPTLWYPWLAGFGTEKAVSSIPLCCSQTHNKLAAFLLAVTFSVTFFEHQLSKNGEEKCNYDKNYPLLSMSMGKDSFKCFDIMYWLICCTLNYSPGSVWTKEAYRSLTARKDDPIIWIQSDSARKGHGFPGTYLFWICFTSQWNVALSNALCLKWYLIDI